MTTYELDCRHITAPSSRNSALTGPGEIAPLRACSRHRTAPQDDAGASDLLTAALSQAAADLLTSPGRGPNEGDVLMQWLQENENALAGVSRDSADARISARGPGARARVKAAQRRTE